MKAEKLAVARAGHDRDQVYVVIGQEQDRILVADGKIRTLERPKAKNPKHLQLIIHLPEALLQQMQAIENDADVRRILKQYRNERDHS